MKFKKKEVSNKIIQGEQWMALLSIIAALWLVVSSTVFAQSCNSSVTASTPNSRFTHNGDTVTDNKTNLVWMTCSLGQAWDGSTCSGSANIKTWSTAINDAENFSFSGYIDWRVPNIKELNSIVEVACESPAINDAIFPSTEYGSRNDGFYWSSSRQANNQGKLIIGFYDGNENFGHGENLYVRLVRGGYSLDISDTVSTINIVGTWDYSMTYESCPNKTEQGTGTWSYHSDGYGLSTDTNNRIDPRSCSYIGPYSIDDGGDHYPANSPINEAEFEAALNAYNSNWSWQNTQFESQNRISVTGTVVSEYSATIIFTR